jgi:hypothetical protein
MNNKEINPQNQYVVSYNNDDFYCNSIGLTTLNNIDSNINVDLSTFCKNPNSYGEFYKKEKCDSTFNTNDSCNLINELCENQNNFNKIKELQTTHSVANSRYSDIDSFYKTEVLKSVNLGIGIFILSFIIYKNY